SPQKVFVKRIALTVKPLLFIHCHCKSTALLPSIGQFAKPVRELDATGINLEAFSDPRVGSLDTGQRRFGDGIFKQDGQTPLPQIWFYMLDEYFTEDVRPCVVLGDSYLPPCRCCQRLAVASAVRDRVKQIDSCKPLERCRYRQQLRLGEGVGRLASKRKSRDARRLCGVRNDDDAIRH